ncbi:cation:proton antiporter domain-containing protein [Flavobacterium sp. HNIBRBA15423]|uniref:cation:proton antiporter domain-containing protein n=1 Tax=Flavobacterium sp. HNIBRBA15423 TaxID=3458683 RepID=UPI004044D17E
MPLPLFTSTAVHLPDLINDLGLILVTAAIAVLVFRKLKQPLVLGYLVAGFLASPNFNFFPTVKDIHSIEVWAEIGVIFLLFSLGLEFSFKKLLKVGGTASVTALTQIVTMLILGYYVGKLMGWENMNCIFLGVILSISSTTIILKAFDELGVKSKKFVENVIGALIVQDIVAILMMVLLSTIAVSQQFSGSELVKSLLKLFFFLSIWFISGIFFIPTLLKKLKHLFTDEMLLIVSLALCLAMVIFASEVGFSPALGAFIMGSIIAETNEAEHIEHLVKPVKDLFGAVFFVSVGMLINPDTLVEYAIPVMLLTLITIFGQSISSTIGTLISGQPLKQSIQTGMSLSQIGEFSFIIATLGVSLKVTSDFLYPIVVAVSAVTAFTTPFMIKFATPTAEFIEKKLPKKWVKKIELYSANSQAIKTVSTWQIVIKAYLLQVVLFSIIIFAIILISKNFLLPLMDTFIYGNSIAAFITLLVLAPFLWALSLKRVAREEVQELLKNRKYYGPVIVLVFLRICIALLFIGIMLNNFFSPGIALLAFVISIIIIMLFPKRINQLYHKIEDRFITNLNEREVKTKNINRNNLSPWDGHMANFTISAESDFTGKTLEEIKIRETIGVNIALIKRGELHIYIPSKDEKLYPNDEISIIGTDAQVKLFSDYLEEHKLKIEEIEESIIALQQFELINQWFIGKTIRESGIREKTNGLVVGVEHNGRRILNPESNLIMSKNDIIWVVGDKKKIKTFFE